MKTYGFALRLVLISSYEFPHINLFAKRVYVYLDWNPTRTLDSFPGYSVNFLTSISLAQLGQADNGKDGAGKRSCLWPELRIFLGWNPNIFVS